MNYFDRRLAYTGRIVGRNAGTVSQGRTGGPLANTANDRPVTIANDRATGSPFVISQANSLFLPFGNFPHKAGLQKLDGESAAFLRANFGKVDITAKRPVDVGVPIYFGHPDCLGRPDTNPAAPAMGWVREIQTEATGISLLTKWSPEGLAAIQNASFRFYSPNWELRRVAGGLQPVRLISVGLTNSPGIPVPAIANDRHKEAAPAKKAAPSSVLSHLAAVKREFPSLAYESQWQLATNRAARSPQP